MLLDKRAQSKTVLRLDATVVAGKGAGKSGSSVQIINVKDSTFTAESMGAKVTDSRSLRDQGVKVT